MGDPWPAAGPGAGVPAQPAVPAQAGPLHPGQEATDPSLTVPAVPAAPAAETGLRWAMIAYLGVPFFSFLLPLAVLIRSRKSTRTRAHAVQALNTALTTLMYDISAAIMAGMLALDSPQVAVAVAGSLMAILWTVTLVYLIRAASAAGRGKDCRIPHWLCATLIK